jgi:isopentenyl-diphosphate delta-isomerase
MSATQTTTQAAGSIVADVSLDGYDEEQVRLMEERCILVDENDKAYGEGSKKQCHLMTEIDKGLLHRAFSVFLFRPSDGRLLLQKRASEKITFPDMWTNTCCSHPLYIQSERIEEGQMGVRNAAIRKLQHELGIPLEQMKPDDFTFLTRIHYLAPSNGQWGEHEVDYILFTALDVTLDINVNEIGDHRYVSKAELEAMFEDPNVKMTPWFKLICRDLLYPWWDEMLAKSRALGWNPEQGTGRVDAHVLEGGDKINDLIKMV